MLVYLIRHGESLLNAQRIHQHAEVDLSELGIKQAEFLADRFKQLDIDLILSSSYKRADQTAQAIAKVKDLPIGYSDLFIERLRPSSFIGKPIDDPKISKIKETIDFHPDPNHHFEDEENFFDLLKRCGKILHELEKHNQENVILVTHGVVIKALIGKILLGKNFGQSDFNSIFDNLTLHNTGITLIEHQENKPWRVITVNDIVHLG
jgi:phosphoserine phosphatase